MRSIPLPIGYVEYQASLVGETTPDQITTAINEQREKALRENPGYVQWGMRAEHTRRGDGLKQTNVYIGFAPATRDTPPLDPRNNNNAPLPRIGEGPLVEDLPVPPGYYEQQFGRGKP